MTALQWSAVAAALGLLVATLLYRDEQFRESLRYSLQGFALYPLFYYSIRFHDNFLFRHLNSAVISKIGVWSYSIYLIHLIVIQLVIAQWSSLEGRPFVMFLIAAAVSALYAAGVDAWLDPYFRRRRRSYSETGVQTAASPAAS